jgi:hypothetical protein
MTRTRHFTALIICVLTSIFALGGPVTAHAVPGRSHSGAQKAASVIMHVDCTKGQTITDALARGRGIAKLEIQFSGVCNEQILIDRDGLTLRGVGGEPVLTGVIAVEGALGVTISDFSIRDGASVPRGGANIGGVSITKGSAARIAGLKIENLPVRGVRVEGAKAEIEDVTVENTRIAFEFMLAQVKLLGTIIGNGNGVGMFVLTSGVRAQADLSFSGNFFGMVVQLSSAFTHFQGHLSASGNQIGVLLSGQGTYAHASFVDIRDNQTQGLVIEEISNLTPFRGAPGGGPSLTVSGNPVGISVTRGSTLDGIGPINVTGNGVGLEVDEGQVRLEGVTIRDNSVGDIKLGFSARATFVGESNSLGSPMQCHETALVRGSIGCGAPLTAAAAASSSRRTDGVEPRELLSRIVQ